VSVSEAEKMFHRSAIVLLLVASGCTTAIQEPQPLPELIEPEPAVEETAPPPPTAEELAGQRAAQLACARITIAATGDIMLGTNYPENHLPDDDGQSFLAEVTPVLSSADIAFGNLEGVLMDGGEPVKQCQDPDACYLFRSPAHYAFHLANAGYTVMSLANNHARDFGEAGRDASMAALDAAGIRHSGRIGDVAVWPNGTVTAALIAFAPFTNSHPMLDIEEAKRQVAALASSYDLVIVSFHGGAEGLDADRVPFTTERYYGEDRGDVARFSRSVVEAGADLVIGHGPHVPRAMEIHNNRLIAYSLGNFATYYGISVAGAKGQAPILVATVNGNGQFISGEIVSAIQIRPGGPQLDAQNRAYEKIWELTEQDFDGGGIRFQYGGSFFPVADVPNACTRAPEKAGM
jgi:hypothetical protein